MPHWWHSTTVSSQPYRRCPISRTGTLLNRRGRHSCRTSPKPSLPLATQHPVRPTRNRARPWPEQLKLQVSSERRAIASALTPAQACSGACSNPSHGSLRKGPGHSRAELAPPLGVAQFPGTWVSPLKIRSDGPLMSEPAGLTRLLVNGFKKKLMAEDTHCGIE